MFNSHNFNLHSPPDNTPIDFPLYNPTFNHQPTLDNQWSVTHTLQHISSTPTYQQLFDQSYTIQSRAQFCVKLVYYLNKVKIPAKLAAVELQSIDGTTSTVIMGASEAIVNANQTQNTEDANINASLYSSLDNSHSTAALNASFNSALTFGSIDKFSHLESQSQSINLENLEALSILNLSELADTVSYATPEFNNNKRKPASPPHSDFVGQTNHPSQIVTKRPRTISAPEPMSQLSPTGSVFSTLSDPGYSTVMHGNSTPQSVEKPKGRHRSKHAQKRRPPNPLSVSSMVKPQSEPAHLNFSLKSPIAPPPPNPKVAIDRYCPPDQFTAGQSTSASYTTFPISPTSTPGELARYLAQQPQPEAFLTKEAAERLRKELWGNQEVSMQNGNSDANQHTTSISPITRFLQGLQTNTSTSDNSHYLNAPTHSNTLIEFAHPEIALQHRGNEIHNAPVHNPNQFAQYDSRAQQNYNPVELRAVNNAALFQPGHSVSNAPFYEFINLNTNGSSGDGNQIIVRSQPHGFGSNSGNQNIIRNEVSIFSTNSFPQQHLPLSYQSLSNSTPSTSILQQHQQLARNASLRYDQRGYPQPSLSEMNSIYPQQHQFQIPQQLNHSQLGFNYTQNPNEGSYNPGSLTYQYCTQIQQEQSEHQIALQFQSQITPDYNLNTLMTSSAPAVRVEPGFRQ
ncbi:hypothetical protein BKA69DRAFT_1088928 [Paraphysoderma sedebokerense]|nr:hypothetical protein BKA69DRAFT_1088928 [Paraphysoderma sedebokerense]